MLTNWILNSTQIQNSNWTDPNLTNATILMSAHILVLDARYHFSTDMHGLIKVISRHRDKIIGHLPPPVHSFPRDSPQTEHLATYITRDHKTFNGCPSMISKISKWDHLSNKQPNVLSHKLTEITYKWLNDNYDDEDWWWLGTMKMVMIIIIIIINDG